MGLDQSGKADKSLITVLLSQPKTKNFLVLPLEYDFELFPLNRKRSIAYRWSQGIGMLDCWATSGGKRIAITGESDLDAAVDNWAGVDWNRE